MKHLEKVMIVVVFALVAGVALPIYSIVNQIDDGGDVSRKAVEEVTRTVESQEVV